MKIEILKIKEDSELPAYLRDGDACMDCYADEDTTIPEFKPGIGCGRGLVKLGFKMALPSGWEAQIRPRSGLALKSGITILNTPGTIDENYRGEVGAIVLNTTSAPFVVKKGDRICQMAIAPTTKIEWNEVETLSETNRGEDGFGSSGK